MHLQSLLVYLPFLFPLALGSLIIPRQSSSNTSALTGGSVCTVLLCITATVYSTDVEYVLQSKGLATLGWMAMGFGTHMADSPMVILWPNEDGTVTLSQRFATSEVMPTVQASPPRIASLQQSATNLTGSTPSLAFTIPKNSDTVQDIIWAFSNINPGSSAVDAILVHHIDSGPTTIDLTGPPTTPSLPAGSSVTAGALTLRRYEHHILAHGVVCFIGFLVVLPIGTLVARYMRTYSTAWLKVHWAIQIFIAGPIIITGFSLGVRLIDEIEFIGVVHFDDAHKRCGLVLFILYFVQCALAYVIHGFKPKSAATRRPIQNYIHPLLGLITIALAMYQVRLGYTYEWVKATSQAPLPKVTDAIWILFVVLFSLAYLGGMALIPRQLKQENESRGLERTASNASAEDEKN